MRYQGTTTLGDYPIDRVAYDRITAGNYSNRVSFAAGTGNTTGASTGSICVLTILDKDGNTVVSRKATVEDAAEYAYQYAIAGVAIV